MADYVDSSSKLSMKILYNCFDSNLMMALALHTSAYFVGQLTQSVSPGLFIHQDVYRNLFVCS